MRWCQKNSLVSSTEHDQDDITYRKEYLEPVIIDEKIRFVSPPNDSEYIFGESITTTNDPNIVNKNSVSVESIATIAERYRYRKFVNGIATEPPEYSNDEMVYTGQTFTEKKMLEDSEYELMITE